MSVPYGTGWLATWLYYTSADHTQLALQVADAVGNSNLVQVPVSSIPQPCWLACRIDADMVLWAELWDSDPRAGGDPIARVQVDTPISEDWLSGLGFRNQFNVGFGNNAVTTAPTVYPLIFDDLLWTAGTPSTIPPYPFAPVQGSIAVTAGDRGQLAIGL